MKKSILLTVLMLLVSIGAFSVRKALVIGMPGPPDAPIANWEQNTRMVEEAFREGGYEVQAAFNPSFGYSFPDLDRFLAESSYNDDLVFYFSGYCASELSSLFLLPSGFEPGHHKLPLDAYNIQRLLNRLRDHNAPVVLILDIYPRPGYQFSPQNLNPLLSLNPNRQAALINIYDPLGSFAAEQSSVLPAILADHARNGTVMLHNLLAFIALEVDEATGGAVSPIVQGTIDTDAFEGLYEMFAPRKGFQDLLLPADEGDGGGSYSF